MVYTLDFSFSLLRDLTCVVNTHVYSTLGRTLVPTRCARGTLSSTESAAYMLQQAKPTGEAGNPRGGVAVLARSSLSPSETGPPSHKQAGKDGGEKPEKNNSRIKAFKSVGCMSVCVCQ